MAHARESTQGVKPSRRKGDFGTLPDFGTSESAPELPAPVRKWIAMAPHLLEHQKNLTTRIETCPVVSQLISYNCRQMNHINRYISYPIVVNHIAI